MSSPSTPHPPGSETPFELRSIALGPQSGIHVQKNVIWALFLRETSTRFGNYNLGLVWALIQPLAMVLIFSLMFSVFLKRTIPGIPYPIFLLTGFLPITMFRNSLVNSLTALSANQGLLAYNQITPLDPFISRLFYEFMIFAISMILFLLVSMWFGLQPALYQPLQIFTATIALVMLSSGLGLLVGTLAHRHSELERIVPICMRPLIFVSCVIHPFTATPHRVQDILLYNPILHVIETYRHGLFPHYPTSDKINVAYPIMLGLFMLTLGLAYYQQNKDMLHDPRAK